MGLFSSKKIYVSSSVYNLAGDKLNRPNFLKSNVFAATMNPYNMYLGEQAVNNYLTGPGIMQRSFFNWAVRNDIAGLPTLTTSKTVSISHSTVQPYVPIPATPTGLALRIQSADLSNGDYKHWAEKWIFENFPEEANTDWVADYDEYAHTINVQLVGGSSYVFGAGNFNKNKKYIAVVHYHYHPTYDEPVQQGVLVSGATSYPSTTDFTFDTSATSGEVQNFVLNKTEEVTKEYSDGSPTVEETTYYDETPTHDVVLDTWTRSYYNGSNPETGGTSTINEWLYVWDKREKIFDSVGTTTLVVNDMGNGETETVTTKTYGDVLTTVYDHRTDSQKVIEGKIEGGLKSWIYEIGTGIPALDALVTESDTPAPEYYPFLPIRLNNKSIREPEYADLYEETRKAYKRATGGNIKGGSIDEILDEIEANEDIGDIDYSYIQWGVSVNVFDPDCRRYMYEFFKNLIPYQNTSPATVTNFQNGVNTYSSMLQTLNTWNAAQSDPNNPLYNTARPSNPVSPYPSSTIIKLRSDHPDLPGFDNRFTWVNIAETNHSGLGKTGATEGDIWFEHGSSSSWTVQTGIVQGGEGEGEPISEIRSMDQVFLFKQTSPNTYSKLSIWGMVHDNFIYGGKSVRTTLKAAIDDVEESVFILPLHAPTVKSMGMIGFTQMTLSNTFLTFNSYQVVKKKWYQTFLGMLLIVVVIVVAAVLLAPASVGAASGVFGANAAVGATLGLTGTAAIVAGAVTNAIAAMVIAQAISTASVAIFGEKWGAIIGAIVSFAVGYGMSNGFSSMTITELMSPQNLLKFSSSLANGYSGFVQAEIGDIQTDMEENQDVFEKATNDIEELMRSMGLTNDLLFDPMSLTDSVKGNGSTYDGSYVPETVDQFIGRTTMTGSDVVDITLSMVSDYADLQLTLPKS